MRDERVAVRPGPGPILAGVPVGIGRDGGAHLRNQAFRRGAADDDDRVRHVAEPARVRRPAVRADGRSPADRVPAAVAGGAPPSRRPRNGARRCPASGRCGRRRWRRSPRAFAPARGRSFALDQSAEPQFGATSSRIVHQRACEASGRRKTTRMARRMRAASGGDHRPEGVTEQHRNQGSALKHPQPRLGARLEHQFGERPDQRVEPVGRAAGGQSPSGRSRTSRPRAPGTRRHGCTRPCS